MEQAGWDRLVEIMRLAAGGDLAAAFMLYLEYGGHLASVLRRELRRVGVAYIDPAELDGLVIDASLELADIAGAWDAERGVLPWTWAGSRLQALVWKWVGTYADPLDDADLDIRGDEQSRTLGHDPQELGVLERLASCHGGCALFLEALERAASPRDRQLLLAYETQAILDDPSPSHTVARAHGMRPDAVRQAVKRVRDRLRRLAADDPHFEPIADLPIVAA